MQTCSSSPMHDSSAAAVLLCDTVEHYCTTCQLPCSAISLIAGQHVGHASLPLAHALQHLPTELLREAKELQQVMEEQCIKSHAVMQQQLRTSMEVLMVAHKDAQAALLRAQEDLRMVKERQRELHAATAVADCNYHYQKQKYAQRLLRLARGCQNLTKMGHDNITLRGASRETSSHVLHPQHERAHGGEGKKQLLQLEKHLRAEWARLHRDNDAAMDLFHDEVEMCVEQRSSVGDDARSSNNKAVDTLDLSDIDAGGQRHRHHHMDLEELLHHRTDMMMEQRSSIPTQSASPCADDVLAAPPPTNLQESNSSPWRRMEQQHEELLRQLDLAMHDATHHSTSRSLVHHAEPAWRSAVELLERTPTSESSRSSGSNLTDVQRQFMDELTNSLRTSRGLF